MKFIVTALLNALICFAAQTWLTGMDIPWWSYFVLIFFVAIIFKLRNGWAHFFAGLLPVFVVMMIVYYRADAPNHSVLSDKIAGMFGMPNHHVLFAVISLLMGLIAGLASTAGGAMRGKKQS